MDQLKTHGVICEDGAKEFDDNAIVDDDGISEILTKTNYEKNIKKIIITWMFRTWSQQYNMNV